MVGKKATPTNTSIFGAPASQPQSTGLFGAPSTTNTPAFGTTSFGGEGITQNHDYQQAFASYVRADQELYEMDITMSDDIETSDDDFEDGVPCEMEELKLPNSNTNRDAVVHLKSTCSFCQYQTAKGWKQLTKHYVRKHPNCEIAISRLAKDQDPFNLSQNPNEAQIFEDSTGMIIKSRCPLCNRSNGTFAMCSEKWLIHFITHTGKSKREAFEIHIFLVDLICLLTHFVIIIFDR